MSRVKEKMINVIQSQPDDASYEEIMRELAFERMVDYGLEDSLSGRVVSNEKMKQEVASMRGFLKGIDTTVDREADRV